MSVAGKLSQIKANRIFAEPATPERCAEDRAQHNRPETAVAVREQRGQAQVAGNAAAGFWHGRRP